MADLGENLRVLAHGAVDAANKRRKISRCLKKNGFGSLGKGGWLGHRGRDVVSGFVIEGSPIDTYISAFILPAFDKQEFISWALGGRIVHCSAKMDSQTECEQAIDFYVANIAYVKSLEDLMSYLDRRGVEGHYPIWVRYISYLRLFDFESAIKYLDDGNRARLHNVQLEKLDKISRFVSAHDKDGISRTFDSWSKASEKIFGPLDQIFDAL